jgi:hypothetical protein
MINVKEFRCGNWLAYDHEGGEHTSYHQVSVDLLRQIELFAKDPNNDEFDRFGFPYFYIDITEKILIACGFTKHDNSNEFWNHWVLPNGWHISEALHNEPSAGVSYGICYWSDNYITVKNLHHLQNLYFALTGKELIYNPKKNK